MILEDFFLDGRAALLILLVVLLEAAVLVLRWRRGSGSPPSYWLSQIVAGAALVTALYLAQTGASALALGAVLALAGVAHLAGYPVRWVAKKGVGRE